eukprot:1141940-Pelagomonas_calceolata.AAC.4
MSEHPPLYLPSHCTIPDSETSLVNQFCTIKLLVKSKMRLEQLGPGVNTPTQAWRDLLMLGCPILALLPF